MPPPSLRPRYVHIYIPMTHHDGVVEVLVRERGFYIILCIIIF